MNALCMCVRVCVYVYALCMCMLCVYALCVRVYVCCVCVYAVCVRARTLLTPSTQHAMDKIGDLGKVTSAC